MSPFDTTGKRRTNWQPKRHFSQAVPSTNHSDKKEESSKKASVYKKIKNIFKASE